MQDTTRDKVIHQYLIHGYGNSIMVQARLAEHGRCFHAEWDPGPPSWRLTYDTAYSRSELIDFLKDLTLRYDLKIEEIT